MLEVLELCVPPRKRNVMYDASIYYVIKIINNKTVEVMTYWDDEEYNYQISSSNDVDDDDNAGCLKVIGIIVIGLIAMFCFAMCNQLVLPHHPVDSEAQYECR